VNSRPHDVERVLQRLLGVVPDLVGADPPLGPVGELDPHVVEAEVVVDLEQQLDALTHSSVICSSVQKMWASSWVKPRTRMMPCSAPEGS
jgi:hypothetical protein